MFSTSAQEGLSAPDSSLETSEPLSDIYLIDASSDDKEKSTHEFQNGEALKLNLNDCVQMTLLNNRELKSKDYDVEGAEWKAQEAKHLAIPVMEYEFISAPAPRDVDNAVESFFNFNLTYLQRGKVALGVPLTSFGKIKLAQQLAQSGIEAEKEKRNEKRNEVVLNVQKLYYGLLLAKDIGDLLRDAKKQMEEELKKREASRKALDPAETIRLQLFYREVIKRLGETEKKSELAWEGLRIQLGIDKNIPFTLAEAHLDPVSFELKDFDYYLELSQRVRPRNRLVDIGLKASEINYRLEKRKLAPDIGIGGYYEFGHTTNSIQGLTLTDDFNDPFNFDRAGIGLRVKGEINVNKYRANVGKARADYFKVAVAKSMAEEALNLELKEAYLNVKQGKKDVENAEQSMKLARQFVFITKTNKDIGVGDKKDYADALQAYLLSRGRYFESVFNYNVAVAALRDKTGEGYRGR